MADEFANNSGQGTAIVVPKEVANKFNWGAFLLSWIWGIGNKSYLTFIVWAAVALSWIPFIGWLAPLGVCIWFGVKGNEWAWQNKEWDSVEHFHSVQKTWAAWGLGITLLGLVLSFIMGILIGIAVVAGNY